MKTLWMAVVAACVLSAGVDPAAADCTFNAQPGDLFVSEIFAQPKTAGAGKEWFEVVNLNKDSRCLTGMKVVWTDQSGGSKTVQMRADVTVKGRGGVAWFGEFPSKKSSDPLKNGDKQFSLKDGSGSIEIQNPDGLTLHKIQYKNAPKGESLNFYQAYACRPPDCVGLGSEDKGTPGVGNSNSFIQ